MPLPEEEEQRDKKGLLDGEEEEEDYEESEESEDNRAYVFEDSRALNAVLQRIPTPPEERNAAQYVAEPLDPVSDVGDVLFYRARYAWSDIIARFPSIVIILSLVAPMACMIMTVLSDNVFSIGPSEFRNMYHPAVRSLIAFEAAVVDWSTRQQTITMTDVERTYPKNRLNLQFTPKDPSKVWRLGAETKDLFNMFDDEALRFIQETEANVFDTTVYLKICWTNNLKFAVVQPHYPMCVPPGSVTPLFYPGDYQYSPDGFLEFEMSGKGRVLMLTQPYMVRTLQLSDRYKWFGDRGFTDETVMSSALRSQINLGYPLYYNNATLLGIDRYNKIVDNFIVDLVNRLDKVSHSDIQVTLGGERVFNALIYSVLDSQIMGTLATIAVAFMLLYLHMGSFVLAVSAVSQMALSYLASYYGFTALTSRKELTLITAISMIVTLCFNCHAVVTVYEGFVQAGLLTHEGRRNAWLMEERIGRLFRVSIPCVAASHVVAALAFGSLILSPAPSVKYFAILMLLNVAADFYMQISFWPAVLVFVHTYFTHNQETLLKQRRATTVFIPKMAYFRDMAMSDYLRGEEATKRMYAEASTTDLKASLFGGSSQWKASASISLAATRDPFAAYNLKMQEQGFNDDEDEEEPAGDEEEDESSYKSKRMVPLPLIFQVFPQIAVPIEGRATVDGALASYNRRVLVAGAKPVEIMAPAIIKRSKIKYELPEYEITRYKEKWEYVGRFIGSERPDDFSTFVTELMCASVTSENLIWDDLRCVKNFKMYPPVREAPGKTEFWWNKIPRILTRPRGDRFHNPRPVKDAFRLNYHTWHSGVSMVQYFVQTKVLRLLLAARYPLVFLGLVGMITMVVMIFLYSPPTEDPILVDASPVTTDYIEQNKQFPITGPCDYCSAYQTSKSHLPLFDLTSMQTCYQQGYGLQMNALVDRCAKCFGNNSCMDCASRPWGISILDDCGMCVHEARVGSCFQCSRSEMSYNTTCFPCADVGKIDYGGASCAVACSLSNCPMDRGKCNPYTGICDCHYNDKYGYFASDSSDSTYCARCAPGFFTAEKTGACLAECYDGAWCGCMTNNRCANCSSHTVGADCAEKRIDACRMGTLSGQNGTCVCPAQYDSQACQYDAICGNRGIYYTTANASITGCGCAGQWEGPQCQYCHCLNGGTCDSRTGECNCPYGWTGIDCSICVPTCDQRGFCPYVYTSYQYDLEHCVPVYCNQTAVKAGIICDECNRWDHALCNPKTQTQCALETVKCNWTGTLCEAIYRMDPILKNNINCSGCVGYWDGPECETCDNPYGLECDYDGVLIGCDHKRTIYAQEPKVVDRCGVCGGTGQCLGCDGIVGSNNIPDSCGVCSGNNECARGEAVQAYVSFVWGIVGEFDPANSSAGAYTVDPLFNIASVPFQHFLRATCLMLLRDLPHIIKGEQSRCAWLDFIDWMQTANRSTTLTSPYASNFTMGFTFPFETTKSNEWNLYHALYEFAYKNNRFSDLGFSVANYTMDMRLEWMRISLSTRVTVGQDYTTMLKQFAIFEELRNQLYTQTSNEGNILHVCPAWYVPVMQYASIRIVKYAVGLCSVAFLGAACVLTMSFRLAAMCLVCVASSMGTSFLVYFVMNWTVGPIEQLGIAVSLAFSSQHALALAVEYSDRLGTSLSPLLPPLQTRRNALRGALVCTVSASLTSLVIALVASLTVVASIIRVFSRIGVILLVTQLSNFLYCFVFLSACILAFGPLTSLNLKYGKLLAFYTTAFVLMVALFAVAVSGQFPTFSDTFVEL